MSKKPAQLLSAVEKLYGQAVSIGETEKYDEGHSTITEDGIPIIEINPSLYSKNRRRAEVAVVHELFHLKMKGAGYPFAGFEHTELFKENMKFFEEMNSHLFSVIEHTLFYEEIRQMGLDPSEGYIEHIANLVSNKRGAEPPNDYQRAIFFARADLELAGHNAKLLKQLEEWYRSKRWDKALSRGLELASIVRTMQRANRDDEALIYIRCLNSLLRDVATVSLARWEERAKGKMNVRYAIIRVDSL